MNNEVKTKWTQALRSGEYKQTKSCLKDSAGYCCLGVLCDLYAKEHPEKAGWKELPMIDRDRTKKVFYSGKSEVSNYLSTDVMNWAGLQSCNPRFGLSLLSRLNDGGHNFEKIANVIENNQERV